MSYIYNVRHILLSARSRSYNEPDGSARRYNNNSRYYTYAFGIYACLDFDGLRDPSRKRTRAHNKRMSIFIVSRGEIYYNTRPMNS